MHVGRCYPTIFVGRRYRPIKSHRGGLQTIQNVGIGRRGRR